MPRPINTGILITKPLESETFSRTTLEEASRLSSELLEDSNLSLDLSRTISDLTSEPVFQDSIFTSRISTEDAMSQKKKILKNSGLKINKPEIIFTNEFKPLAKNTNQASQTVDQNLVNIEFDSFNINFNTIVKVIEMHRVTNDIMIRMQQDLLMQHTNYSKESHYNLYEYLKRFLLTEENLSQVLDTSDNANCNVEKAADKLLEIASLSGLEINTAPEEQNSNRPDVLITRTPPGNLPQNLQNQNNTVTSVGQPRLTQGPRFNQQGASSAPRPEGAPDFTSSGY